MGGWWVGLAIGAVVVVIVVVVVTAIILLARRISIQAEMGTAALDEARVNTIPLWDVMKINDAARAILRATRTARSALGGDG